MMWPMKKFLVLYRSEGALSGKSVSEMIANTSPEQMKAGMAVWQAWFAKFGHAVTDPGSPLDHSTTVSDGTSSAGMTSITGYSMIEAASMDDAVAMMKDHPHFKMPGASLDILESVPMPGM
jgi:hypothetical protein